MMQDSTRRQIEATHIDPNQPLLICDVDEVVVHFLRGLEAHLAEQDLWLDAASFALNGNIRRRADNQPVEPDRLGDILHSFFRENTASLALIDGARDGLEAISRSSQVVMLTNLPEVFLADRQQNLKSHDIHFPVISNSGPKGPAVAALAGDHAAPVAFIDDSPGYLASVRDHCSHVSLIHFMQDERFARHVRDMDYVSLKTDNWADAGRHIQAVLEG